VCTSQSRSQLFGRAEFFGVMSAAALPFALGPSAVAAAADTNAYPLPPARGPLTRGNAHAMALAAASPLVHATYASVAALAASLADSELKAYVVSFLHEPSPDYAANHPTAEARTAVRDALARAGFVKPDDPVSGIFPPGTEHGSPTVVQPFWSAPGSATGSHHAYPGGLAVHEFFNATMAQQFAATYDAHYFAKQKTVDRDTVVGAALYHDIMKAVVLQWREDGTIFDELTIAGTGAHHILSGAEAIVHGHSPRFVLTLLSAHDDAAGAAPLLTDHAAIVDWCRAAAIVAGVDPVQYGLVKPAGSGYALALDPVPLEAFISNLSDHDYVLAVPAMRTVSARLKSRYAQWQPATTFDWYRAAVLSRTTALALYDTLGRHGESAFNAAVQRIESTLHVS
jgi:hypothetical protein